MSDMIDRQDAIDAMSELMRHWFGGDPKDEVKEIKRELEKLPTVQTCEDAVSRQAAIGAVHEEFDECLVWDESGRHTADEVEQILDKLPSVQPQPEEDCDTCKHGYFGDRQCDNCRVRYPSHYEREEEHHGSDGQAENN